MSYLEILNSAMEDDVLDLLKKLIACPSITPNDANCQEIIANRLKTIGFHCETLVFDDVTNLWAVFGSHSPLFVFAGHTDVVPTGELSDWHSPPFNPVIRDNYLYGRGAVDMKGALAAYVVSVEHFLKANPTFKGSIGFLITSDEEGPAINGTQKVMEVLEKRGIQFDYCLIGEPSSIDTAGDQIRIGRRGSLHGKLTINAKQGHVAHPHLAINAIHLCLQPLAELVNTEWDQGNESFPPTTFQITNIHSGTGATNVIPGHLEALFNFRFGTASTPEAIQAKTEAIFAKIKNHAVLDWKINAQPFLTQSGDLLTVAKRIIEDMTGLSPILSTGGGTSDGRFIAPTGCQLIELGLSHATAHHTNECVKVQDVVSLTQMYLGILSDLFKSKNFLNNKTENWSMSQINH